MNKVNFYQRDIKEIKRILNEILACNNKYEKKNKEKMKKWRHYFNLAFDKNRSLGRVLYDFEMRYVQLVEELADEKYPLPKELPETGIFKIINRSKNKERRKIKLKRDAYTKPFYSDINKHTQHGHTTYSIFESFDAKKELFRNIPEDMIELRKRATVLKEEHDKLQKLADEHISENNPYDVSELYKKYGVPKAIQGYEKYMYNLFITGRASNIQEALDKLENYAFRQQVKNELTRLEEDYENSLRQQANMYDDIINKQGKVISEMNSINDKLNTNLREQQYKLDQIQSEVDDLNYKMKR